MAIPRDLLLPDGYTARATTRGAYWLRPGEARLPRKIIAARSIAVDPSGGGEWSRLERDAWRDAAAGLAVDRERLRAALAACDLDEAIAAGWFTGGPDRLVIILGPTRAVVRQFQEPGPRIHNGHGTRARTASPRAGRGSKPSGRASARRTPRSRRGKRARDLTRRARRLSLRAMRTLALLLSVFLSACATAAVAGGARTYPPSPSSSDLDAYGTARAPEIARCMSRQQMRSNFGESLFGPSVVPENKSYEYQVCWCKAHGFRGMGAGGACLD